MTQKIRKVMRLNILGSSSRGNCYLFDAGDEVLMVECGVDFKLVQKAVDFNVSRIVGTLVSHEHGDHAKSVGKCLKLGIPVYCSRGTGDALKIDGNYLFHSMSHLEPNRIGKFTVYPFNVHHDAAEPFGFLIHHPQCGTVLFATDTYYLPYQFGGLNNILIECNYSREILDENIETGRVPAAIRNRILHSHLELETCIDVLNEQDLTHVNNIVLIHLSSDNADADNFKLTIADATGKNTIVARPGMTIDNFDITPF